MSSSYKQKKSKTLATRKKTRKRRMDDGMTFEDDSGRMLQPPSTRDPRWKKLSINDVVSSISKTTRQKKTDKKRRKLALDRESDEKEEWNNVDVDGGNNALVVRKTPLQLRKSLDDVVEKAAAMHAEIRRKDGRQKTKVLLLVDCRSVFKLMKKKMRIRREMVKLKSRRGVGSAKKPDMVYKNTGLVKTPLDRFKDVNKTVLTGYKSGKLSSILAEDLSFYPYTDFTVQHVIFVAKETASAINLDHKLLQNVKLHLFVIATKSTTGLSEDDVKALKEKYEVTSAS
ncbi:unnamed protein product [Peronospora destructor]|uniref:Uncharacterized protein n=1 Tax=Peronospora destructor TaxID=86335 RepID=A0AAV0VF20_9STRA|nr:unnamed protein product [Peronospora destructor]